MEILKLTDIKYSIKNILNKFNKNEKLEFLFFWGHTEKENIVTKACLSQWYPCEFEIDGVIYFTTEQFMMAQKAILFNDIKIYKQILRAKDPKEYKSLGRQINNFSEEKWEEYKYSIVIKGNLAKFSQNMKLKEFLMKTKDKILVEASPYDKIWGIGKSADSKNLENPNTWNGENLLGFSLMEVRDLINLV